MFKLLEWLINNWKTIILILTIGTLIGFIKPISDFIRNIKLSLREIFTPVGFVVTLALIAFALFIVYMYKGGLFK